MTSMLKIPIIHEDDIPARIRAHMERAETFQGELPLDLLSLLGCPHRFTTRPDVYAEHQGVIGDALLVLLDQVANRLGMYADDAPSILSGLYASGAWRRCILQESTAYNLAAVTLCHLETFSDDDGFNKLTQPAVCRLLNEWLRPPGRWNKVPDVESGVIHMFGDAWCALRDPAGQGGLTGAVVHRERPPFLPGLCPAQDGILSAPLPDDVGYPE
jgi:hypothetical protein